MQIEQLSVDLRRRNSWETLDLGLAMMRAWWGPALRAWCVTYWPFALLVFALTWMYPSVGWLIVWWSKPAFDRVLVHIYSGAVFGSLPGTKDVWRALPRLLGSTRLLAGLTFYRFSMARSFFLPVWQLEGQRGKAAGARRRTLGARGYGYAAWLTFVCSNLVFILQVSGIALTWLFVPRESAPLFSLRDIFDPAALWVSRYANLLTFAADTLVEPYFVAAGFSLYLNRRSELEGWDIEVTFRQMAQRRIESIGARAPLLCSVAVALVLAISAIPDRASAAVAGNADNGPIQGPDATAAAPRAAQDARRPTPAAAPYAEGEIRRRITAVKDDSVFGDKETRSYWAYRQTGEDPQMPQWLRSLLKWLRRISEATARFGRVVVWIAGAALLGLAIYLIVRYRERWRPRAQREVPRMLFGLDVRRESLPEDIAAAARELLARGDAVSVLSLLYRGALSALIHAAAVDFLPGDTERDCWRRAQPVMSAGGLGYFRRLLDAWLWAAYGRRPPSVSELERLCDAWPQHFSKAALVGDGSP